MDQIHTIEIEKVTISQNCYCLIDAFLFNTDSLLDFRCYELKDLFYQTIAELFFSEIEILAWLIYIEEIGIKVDAYNVKEFLIFVGLQTKINLGSDVKKIIRKFKAKNPRIIEKFEAWSDLNKLDSQISTKKIGEKYRELTSFRGISKTNYNFYLNDIFRSSINYQKQDNEIALNLSLDVEKGVSKKNIFLIKKKQKTFEDKEYDLKEFDPIDI